MASDNDDDKDDDDDVNSKGAEVAEIGTGDALTMLWLVSKPEIPIKGRKKFSCRHERQIREDKSAEQKAKPYQWLFFFLRIKFVWQILLVGISF